MRKRYAQPCRIVRFSRSINDVFSFEESSESCSLSSNRHPTPITAVDGELPIPLNRRLSRSDTIPPCAISSSFSFISSLRFLGLQGQVDGGPSLPNLRWCDINC